MLIDAGGLVAAGFPIMAFDILRRGILTYYYYTRDNPLFSALVTEAVAPRILKVYFSGVTGGHTAEPILGLENAVAMDPEREIPFVFDVWSVRLREAGLCDSVADIDFIEMQAFGCQPKSPNPLVDPAGYAAEIARLRQAFAKGYGDYFRRTIPHRGLPVRFTVHVVVCQTLPRPTNLRRRGYCRERFRGGIRLSACRRLRDGLNSIPHGCEHRA